jgi:hypothetical protein
MAGIAHHDIEVAMLLDDRGDAGIDRFLRSDIELDGVQIDAVVLGMRMILFMAMSFRRLA